MGYYKPLAEVIRNAPHYVALGQTTVYLDSNDPDLPWGDVSEIDGGSGYRLGGPTSFNAIAKQAGLTLKWSVDFEGPKENGSSVSRFDRDRLRLTMQKLPAKSRKALAVFLEKEVLPGVQKTSAEWRELMNRQIDSEDCVRGLIAFARE